MVVSDRGGRPGERETGGDSRCTDRRHDQAHRDETALGAGSPVIAAETAEDRLGRNHIGQIVRSPISHHLSSDPPAPPRSPLLRHGGHCSRGERCLLGGSHTQARGRQCRSRGAVLFSPSAWFRATCVLCRALPQPRQHVAGDLFDLRISPCQSVSPVGRPRRQHGRARLVRVRAQHRVAVTDAFHRLGLTRPEHP